MFLNLLVNAAQALPEGRSEHNVIRLRTRRRGRILVVDDEAHVANVVQRVLAKEHDVVVTLRARDALALCTAGERFDLILCDLMMPAMTGMELHRELSLIAPDQTKRMPFMTGGAFAPAARAFLLEPPKEYIEKPFDVANLRAIVQRYLRQEITARVIAWLRDGPVIVVP